MAVNLGTAGVGKLTLLDRDVVAFENLHRQPTYRLADIGMSKAEVVSRYLKERVPGLEVAYLAANLEAGSAPRLFRGVDVAVDCLDNFAGRYALNEACVERRIPFVHTGATGWEASVGVFWSPKTACFRCVFPDTRDEGMPTCEDAGTLGALTSYIASVGALETVKVLSGIGSSLMGSMLVFDGRRLESHKVSLEKRRDCATCGLPRRAPTRKRVIELCGDRELYIDRAFPAKQFARIAERLGGNARRMGESIVVAKVDGLEVSLFRSGGMLVKGTSSSGEALDAAAALGIRVEPLS